MPLIALFCFATLASIAFIVVTWFIVSMVQLVGMGDGFWSVWIVQLDVVLAVIAIGLWIGTARLINKKKKLNASL